MLGNSKGKQSFKPPTSLFSVFGSLRPIIFLPAILGPEMAAPILWVPGIFWFFLLEKPHTHKIPRFRGGSGILGRGRVEVPILFLWACFIIRVHTKGVMQPHATLRRVLRRFFNSKCFLEGFLEGACKGFQQGQGFLEGFLEGGVFHRRRLEGAQKVLRRQKHVLSQSTTPFACTLTQTSRAYQRHYNKATNSELLLYATPFLLCLGPFLERKIPAKKKLGLWHPRKRGRDGNSLRVVTSLRVVNLLCVVF